ncbi:hypothetical protein [Falsihalocynthiibacter arcticus]|nr:hypothetical protein [Falsihalocynthiibacter arcticus]
MTNLAHKIRGLESATQGEARAETISLYAPIDGRILQVIQKP